MNYPAACPGAQRPSGEGREAVIAPTLSAADLRRAGREPALPFAVTLADGRVLTMRRLLRVLPGKRLVGEAECDGRPVLAKLFVAEAGARHWQRERDGLAALAAAGIATPAVLAAMELKGGGHALLTEFLAPVETVAERWASRGGGTPGSAEAVAELAPALTLLGRMHARGLVQEDLHLGNFLRHHDRLHVIDGDGVRVLTPAAPLNEAQASANLAILLAQLPPGWDAHRAALMDAYREGNPTCPPEPVRLQAEIDRVRAWRLKDYLDKTLRECTLFEVRRDARRFSSTVRACAAELAPVIADPDRWMANARLLKDGGTATVARIEVGGRPLVIKRYNLKNARHALSRAWRPSRAWHSWLAAHRLRFLGIATPAPLALVEERFGPLRRRAWLVTEHCAGPSLLEHLAAHVEEGPPPAEAAALRRLFATLHRERISHGDLKATNLLWQDGEVVVIDLDAMVQHRSAAAHARAWRRDRTRLLRNWPAGSGLHRWLQDNLPPP